MIIALDTGHDQKSPYQVTSDLPISQPGNAKTYMSVYPHTTQHYTLSPLSLCSPISTSPVPAIPLPHLSQTSSCSQPRNPLLSAALSPYNRDMGNVSEGGFEEGNGRRLSM